MSSYYVWMAITLISLTLPLAFGTFALAYLDRAMKVLLLYLGWVLATELACFYAALELENNMPVYNVSAPVQFLLICLYFSETTILARQKTALRVLAVCGMLSGILNLVLYTRFDRFAQGFVILQGLVAICLAAFSILSMIRWKNTGTRSYFPHFYVAAAMMILWSILLGQLACYNQMIKMLDQHKWLVAHALQITNSVVNLAFAIIFLLILKRSRHAATV